MGQLKLIIALIMIGLFSIAIMGFAVQFASDNASPIRIDQDPELDTLDTRTQENVSGFNEESENTYYSIINTTISPGSNVPQSAAPFALTPYNALGVVTNILYVAYQKIFGTGTGFGIFLTTLIGILTFLVGLFIYKTLRGLPD